MTYETALASSVAVVMSQLEELTLTSLIFTMTALPRSGRPPTSLAGSGAERGWGFPKPPPKRALPSLDSPTGAGTSPWGRFQFPFRRGAPTPRQGTPVSTPDVRPLPWREAERKGVGGFPQAPTKEGSALSGLSRRMALVASSAPCCGRPLQEADGGLEGYLEAPAGAAPSLDSPPERARRPGGGSSSRSVGARGCAPVPAPDVCPLPWREAERTGVGGGGTPKPPPKRAPPSLDSRAGWRSSLRRCLAAAVPGRKRRAVSRPWHILCQG